jgi:hypothetical protein
MGKMQYVSDKTAELPIYGSLAFLLEKAGPLKIVAIQNWGVCYADL